MSNRLKTLKGKLFNKTTIYIFVVFVVLFCLCFLFPASADDWSWGAKYGLDEFYDGFRHLNGRYAGSLLILTISRNNILRMLFISITFISLFIVIVKTATSSKRLLPYVFATLMMFIISRNILVQTVVWASGFANYVPPALFTMLSIFLMKNIYEDEVPKYSVIRTVFICFIGIFGALFMENITIFNVILSIWIVVFSVIKFKKLFLTHILFLFSTVAGALIMFLNPAYGMIATGTDYYRTVGGIGAELVTTIGRNIYLTFEFFFAENAILLTVLSALCIFVALMNLKRCENKYKKIVVSLMIELNIFSLTLIFIKYLYPEWHLISGDGFGKIIYYIFLGIIGFTYYCTILLLVLLNVNDSKTKIKIIFFEISSVIMIAPLMLVSPVSARCYFSSCIMFIMMILLLFEYLMKNISIDTYKYRIMMLSGFCAISVICVFVFSMYANIYLINKTRDEYIQKQINDGSKDIVVCMQPHPDFVLAGNPKEGHYEIVFKTYYNLDQNLEFTLVEYEDFKVWKQEYDKTHG